ncbi:MAG: metallophosphoesterase [Cyclobacteriaceae bacterium]|nr:metallophosphoesterase [Cyclobacteriaceae bacterium]
MKIRLWVLAVVWFACQPGQTAQLPYSVLWQEPGSYAQPEIFSSSPDSVFNSGWKYVKGLPDETLFVAQLPQPDSLVELPHRVLSPNTALWYKQIISFSGNGVLSIQADDGAQVWINDEAAERIQGDAFKVFAVEDAHVLIRVLNNAMSGGLKRVSYFREEHFEALQQEYEKQLAAKRKHEKQVLQIDSRLPLWVGPWLTRTDSFFTIRLITEGDPVKLHWGLEPGKLNQAEQEEGKLVSFNITIPDTDWFYKICSGSYCTPVYPVAAEKQDFSFSVWGDSQSGWHSFQKHIQHLSQEQDAFTVGVGDLVGNGCKAEEWRAFTGLLSDYTANRPAYLIAGNHDYDGYYTDLNPQGYHQYASPAGKPYFAWTYANCAFIAIDPNTQFPIGFPEEQRDWFYGQLQSDKWKRAAWRFVFVHQPPYSQGWAGYQGDAVVRELLEPVMEEAGIDFVIAGHTHDYERMVKHYGKQRTHFIITGGGGGSLEPAESSAQPKMDTVIKAHHYIRFRVSGNKLDWATHDLGNQLIDTKSVLK